MDIFQENDDIALYLTISVTVVVLIASLIYSSRNIARLWSAGDPHTGKIHSNKKSNSQSETDTDESDDEGIVKLMVSPFLAHLRMLVGRCRCVNVLTTLKISSPEALPMKWRTLPLYKNHNCFLQHNRYRYLHTNCQN